MTIDPRIMKLARTNEIIKIPFNLRMPQEGLVGNHLR